MFFIVRYELSLIHVEDASLMNDNLRLIDVCKIVFSLKQSIKVIKQDDEDNNKRNKRALISLWFT